MPKKDPRAGENSARRAAETAPEAPFDVTRLHSLTEASAYRDWKQEVPAPVRHAVESAMLGQSTALEPTGLPRVDVFLHALADQLIDPTQPPSELPQALSGLFESLRSIETDVGVGDGMVLLADKDVPFTTKLALWRDHLAPLLRWLREQDLTPPEPEEIETAAEPVSSPDESLPPPTSDSFKPSMEELEKGKEGEPNAHFTVTPFYGGYYRQNAYGRWNAKRLAWEALPAQGAVLEEKALEDLSVRMLSGAIRGGESVSLPIPYGWTADITSLETRAPSDKIHLTQDQRGSISLKVDASGVFSYRLRIGKRKQVKLLSDAPHQEEKKSDARLPKDLTDLIAETKQGTLTSGGKARFLIKSVREHLEYSNESKLNAVYQVDPATYFEKIWQAKKADCDVANTVAAAVLREAGIACRMVTGHYVKSKSKDNQALMTSGTGHAWLEVFDEETKTWFRADATPKGDPTLDEERPDEEEQTESGDGDYGEQEAEIMSDKKLEELIRSLEEAQGKPQEQKSGEERLLEAFAEQAACSTDEARQVISAFRRLRELQDAKGERIGQKLINAWKKLIQSRMSKQRVYEGPVRMSEGDELADPVMARIDLLSREKNPMGFARVTTIEKRQKLFGGVDFYLLIDGSASMAEVDPKSHRVKAELQRDCVMLCVDSLMQCAFLSRQAGGRLTAPLPIRVQVVSIHGNVSVDLPLVDRWGPKEQVALYRSVMRTATDSTPDHIGLAMIEKKILAEREAWKQKTHTPGEKPPLEFVVTTLDGGSDDPAAVRETLERLRRIDVVDFAYGMTAAAKPIKVIYAPNAKVIEELPDLPDIVTQDTLGVFKKLYPERVKRP